jgi:hypothetical protein
VEVPQNAVCSVQNILKPQPQIDKYSGSRMYQLKCLDFPLKYVGQTGRTFKTRYKEHIHDIRSNNSNSGYSSHILNTGHTYGTITDTMEIITRRKGKHLNALEKYHIYKVSKKNLHMNDTNIDTYNPILEELHKITLYPPHLSPLLITTAYKYGSKHTTSTLVKTTPHATGGNKRKRASIK